MNRRGIVVFNTVVTTSTEDPYPVVETNDVKGGLHSVPTILDRQKIPLPRRMKGMMCYVEETVKTYQLVGGLDEAHWQELDRGTAYMYSQDPASAVWTIDHNLGRYPEAEIQVNGVWAEATVDHDGKNRTIITFANPVAGIAQLK